MPTLNRKAMFAVQPRVKSSGNASAIAPKSEMNKILIIEDEENLRTILIDILETEGFKTLVAEDGYSGIHLAVRENPDLILCDILMPESNGYEVLAAIRQNPNLAAAPFIFLSSKAQKQDVRRGMELGADDYISKPFTREELLGAINTQLKKYSFRREYYIDRLRQLEKELSYLVNYDSVTKLPNHLSLREQFALVLRKYELNERAQLLPIFCLCLDRLTKINASFGYRTGDRLLKNAARRMQNCLGEGDTLAYISSNKFVIILAETATQQEAIAMAQQLLDCYARTFIIEQQEIFVTASIGITFYPTSGSKLEELLRQAHIAMNAAEKQGGDRYEFYTGDDDNVAYERIILATALQKAIQEEQLKIHYQPKVSLATGKIVGAEALVRWNHPERGNITPSQFIPIAEETGLIVSLGEWVLKTAYQQIRCWNDRFGEPITLAVNLSSRQFAQTDLLTYIARLLDENSDDASKLELEITESVLIQNPQQASQKLHELKKLGIKIAIDDFGTGYSSLSYLRQFPFDILKIDRHFVRNLDSDETNTAIVKAILQIARSLELKVVAEGVETEAELAFFARYPCDEIQGYVFSRPLSVFEFEKLLESKKRLRLPA
jgi:diguanylate cyclase